jgi:hypothetical protein
MTNCPNCSQAYIKFIAEMKIAYKGGMLIVTDFPHSKCACDTTINLSHGIVAELYRDRLTKYEIRGDVSISLNLLLEEYKTGEIINVIKNEHENLKKMDWIKEKVGLTSNEELFLIALALLSKTIEFEQRGYTLYALRESELPKEISCEEIKYRQIDTRELI